MTNIGRHTKEELFSQTQAWAGALHRINSIKNAISAFKFQNYDQIIFTGCGSTYYLSLFAANIFQRETGILCRAVPGGELLMHPESYYRGKNNLLVSISRSGSTSETVRASEQFRQSNAGEMICITNYADQPLPALAVMVIAVEEGQEESVVQTRSFSSMCVAANALVMLASDQLDLFETMKKLPAVGEKMMKVYRDRAKEIGENLDFDRIYFLGSGPRYGLACEGCLKMKEMTLTHTEAYHFLEFRHGPKSMVNKHTLVVGMISDHQKEFEQEVINEMAALDATTLTIAEDGTDISFNSHLSERIRHILYLPTIHMMAYYRSLKKGLDPDNPRNLTSVVQL